MPINPDTVVNKVIAKLPSGIGQTVADGDSQTIIMIKAIIEEILSEITTNGRVETAGLQVVAPPPTGAGTVTTPLARII
jgi:hypothetical protein